jgi:hypothetical protein
LIAAGYGLTAYYLFGRLGMTLIVAFLVFLQKFAHYRDERRRKKNLHEALQNLRVTGSLYSRDYILENYVRTPEEKKAVTNALRAGRRAIKKKLA